MSKLPMQPKKAASILGVALDGLTGPNLNAAFSEAAWQRQLGEGRGAQYEFGKLREARDALRRYLEERGRL